MIINFRCKRAKEEHRYIEPFIRFYVSRYSPRTQRIDIECPDEVSQGKAPDYFLIQPKIGIEVKQVYERNQLERITSVAHNFKRLQDALDTLAGEDQELDGLYFLLCPWDLRIERGKEPSIARDIINGLKQGRQEITVNSYTFRVIGTQKNEKGVILTGSVGPGEWFSPAETIVQNIKDKLAIADKQLGSLTGKAEIRILLLVNKYFFGHKTDHFIEALASLHQDLLRYHNIDEIWLQIEKANGQFYHELVYRRELITSLERGKVEKDVPIYLYQKWFYPLAKLGDKQKEALFATLKQLLKRKKPHEIFADKSAREEMVKLGTWLAEKKRYKDVVWIVEKFINDPDPEEPERYSGSTGSNYHQQIAEGMEPPVIATVLGRLCWVIKALVLDKDYIGKALVYTEKLLKHPNLYVKLQAIFPLVEIAARRQWLTGWGKRPRAGEYKKFHELVFSLVDLVARNPSYKAIARWLCHVFAYYKDLSTSEAEQVLDSLKITEESGHLFIYFAIFRERHYKDLKVEYNPEGFKKKLEEIILNRDDRFCSLRAVIASSFWKILENDRNEFEVISPYIDLFLDEPYERNVYMYLENIIRDWIERKPDICVPWYKKMLARVSEYAERLERLGENGGLWLMHTEPIIESIAKKKPNEVSGVVKELVSLWEKGVQIGNIIEILRRYNLMVDLRSTSKIRGKIRASYGWIRKAKPR